MSQVRARRGEGCAGMASLHVHAGGEAGVSHGVMRQGRAASSCTRSNPDKKWMFLQTLNTACAGYALRDPACYAGRAIELAGDELTPLQMCEVRVADGGLAPLASRLLTCKGGGGEVRTCRSWVLWP